jgi:hypothetical protein
MRRFLPLLLPLLAACAGDDSTPGDDDDGTPGTHDTEPQGQCGDVTYWDVTVTGRVRTPQGGPAVGASVRIENREWDPGTVYVTGTTDAMGAFSVLAPQMVQVEECSGLLGHYAVAELGELSGEAGLDSAVFTAVDQGTFVADISQIPIVLEEPATP